MWLSPQSNPTTRHCNRLQKLTTTPSCIHVDPNQSLDIKTPSNRHNEDLRCPVPRLLHWRRERQGAEGKLYRTKLPKRCWGSVCSCQCTNPEHPAGSRWSKSALLNRTSSHTPARMGKHRLNCELQLTFYSDGLHLQLSHESSAGNSDAKHLAAAVLGTVWASNASNAA